MTLTLHFEIPVIGDVVIKTNSAHGSYDLLLVNGENLTEDGDVVEMVREAIGHERFITAMFEASEAKDRTYRQQREAV